MVLTALNANNFTVTATAVQTDSDLQQEVDLTERAIRNAATRQRYEMAYNARIVGNPFDDPLVDANLTPIQIAYRDAFVNAGYLVTLNGDTGFWNLSWNDEGVEAVVSVYSIRTTVVPGAVSAATITAIDGYFDSLTPATQTRTTLVSAGPGSDTDETDFGATVSSYYEYIAVVRQHDPSIDNSAGLRIALTGTALGYLSTPTNVFVYKVA